MIVSNAGHASAATFTNHMYIGWHQLEANDKRLGRSYQPPGPGSPQIERTGSLVTPGENLFRFKEHARGTDVMGAAHQRPINRISVHLDFPGNRDPEARSFPPVQVKEILYLRQNQRGVQRSRDHSIRSAAGTSFDCFHVIWTDHEYHNASKFRVFPDCGEKNFTSRAGHIQLSDDEIYLLCGVYFQRLVIRSCLKYKYILAV